MTKDPHLKRRTYRRDDGVLMVELRPGQFVNEHVAASLLQPERCDSGFIEPPQRGRRRVQMRGPEDAR